MNITNYATLDRLINDRIPFAAWRIPGEKVIHIVKQSKADICLLHDISELNGRKGFIMVPFCNDKKHPIVLIPSEDKENTTILLNDKDDVSKVSIKDIRDVSVSKSYTHSYSLHFDAFMKALKQNRFDKLVLSRCSVLKKEATFSEADVFYTACRNYIYSYIYLCYTPFTGVWIGSTPEVILSGEKGTWSTVALAGTKPLVNGELPKCWDDKNKSEQDMVVSYIRQQLLKYDIHSIEKGPYSVYAGALSHLKTDFCFTLNNTDRLGDILKLLHPTPAVCGLPKNEVYKFIIDNEGYDRSYYSGFVGWLDPKGKTDLYVNLRCMHVHNKQLNLYAGGGLLLSSKKKDEWMETENKLQTMRRLIIQKY